MAETGVYRLRVNPDVVWAEVDGELVLLDARTGNYYGLNRVGADIWRLLTQACPTEAILGYLLDSYEVEPGPAERDLADFLADLMASGLAQNVQ
jgi:hypothetical protein